MMLVVKYMFQMIMEIPLELMLTISQKLPWMFFPDIVPLGHPIFDIINTTNPEVSQSYCCPLSKLLYVSIHDRNVDHTSIRSLCLWILGCLIPGFHNWYAIHDISQSSETTTFYFIKMVILKEVEHGRSNAQENRE